MVTSFLDLSLKKKDPATCLLSCEVLSELISALPREVRNDEYSGVGNETGLYHLRSCRFRQKHGDNYACVFVMYGN